MLEMTRLPRAPETPEDAAARSYVGCRPTLTTVGVVIVWPGCLLGGLVFVTRPQPPTHGLTTELVDRNIESLSPRSCFGLWTNFFENGLEPSKTARRSVRGGPYTLPDGARYGRHVMLAAGIRPGRAGPVDCPAFVAGRMAAYSRST